MSDRETNLLGLDRVEMRDFVAQQGEPAYRGDQLVKWIHQQRCRDFEAMTNLSKTLRARLAKTAAVAVPELVNAQSSTDGTRKWLLRLDDDNCIETVFIPESDRGTLCISSQVGCALNCSFCATARQGYGRNLTVAEIVGQLWLAQELLCSALDTARPVTNVVLMGMGEPLLNFDHVVKALRLMLDDFAYGLSRRRVTLSTAGVVPAIDRLKVDCPVALAVSLHAATDELRDRLVPLNRKYPIASLMDACRRYVEDDPRARVTFEYVMLDQVNDQPKDAQRLVRVLEGVPAKVNLIPFNSFAGAGYRRSEASQIDRFRDTLLAAGIMTITRKTRGDDIAAACGQLAGRVRDRTRRAERFRREAGLAC